MISTPPIPTRCMASRSAVMPLLDDVAVQPEPINPGTGRGRRVGKIPFQLQVAVRRLASARKRRRRAGQNGWSSSYSSLGLNRPARRAPHASAGIATLSARHPSRQGYKACQACFQRKSASETGKDQSDAHTFMPAGLGIDQGQIRPVIPTRFLVSTGRSRDKLNCIMHPNSSISEILGHKGTTVWSISPNATVSRRFN